MFIALFFWWWRSCEIVDKRRNFTTICKISMGVNNEIYFVTREKAIQERKDLVAAIEFKLETNVTIVDDYDDGTW